MTDHRAEAEELLRHRNVSRAWPHIALHAIDVLAARLPQTPPSSAPAAPVSDAEPDQAPAHPQDATGPQKGAGRIGWLQPSPDYKFRYLAREVEGGWSGTGSHDAPSRRPTAPGWPAMDLPDAVFTPLLPGFFVAPDGDDVPTIWRETDGEPVWVMVRTPYFAAFFDAVAGLLETREEA